MNKRISDAVKVAIQQSARATLKNPKADWMRALELAVYTSHMALPKLQIPADDLRAQAVASLYYSMLDLCDAMHLCAGSNRSIAIPTLARQVLDAYVDFMNAISDHGVRYVQQMELADDMNWLEALTQASRGTNPYLRSFAEPPPVGRVAQDS